MTAAPFGHGSDRRWGDSAPGTSMPGAAVCWSGLCPRLAHNVHQLLRVGLTVLCARMHRALAPQPQQASERRPGPPAGCPPCRAGRSGAPARACLSHFLAWLTHTCPMAAAAVHVRSPGPVPRAAAGPRGRRPARGAGACRGRRRVRDHLRPLLPRPARLLRADARQPPGGRGRAAAQLRLGLPRAARRGGRHRAAPMALHDRAQPLRVGPSRAARAGLRRRAGGRLRIVRRDVGPGPAPRRPARAGGGATASARRPARRAGPLRARRPVARADRGGARGAPREGQGARLPGARGADACARRARRLRASRSASSSPRSPAASRGAACCAGTSTAVPAARTSSARSAASAPRSRRSCRSCPPWA